MISVMFFLFLTAQTSPANDLLVKCPYMGTTWINKFLMTMSRSDEHPYGDACEPIDWENGTMLSAKSNAEKNDLNVYMISLPNNTHSGKSVNDFFKMIRSKIQVQIVEEREKIKDTQNCLKTKSMNDCFEVSEETKSSLGITGNYTFKDLIADARFNLVLGTRPSNFLGKNRDDPRVLNQSMNTYGVYKEESWNGSKGKELSDARYVLNGYFEEAQKSLGEHYDPKNIKQNVKLRSMVSEQRHNHFAAYTALLTQYPILQFIKSENPDANEVTTAVNRMMNSLNEEEKWLAKTTESLDQKDSVDTDLLKLLNYRTQVQETLAEKNEYCGIARDFKQLAEAKGMGFDLAVIAPVVTASLLVPVASIPMRAIAATAVAAGTTGTGLALVTKRQFEIDESKYQVMGRFNPKSEEELKVLSEHLSDRNFEIFFTAVGVTEFKAAFKYTELAKRAKAHRATKYRRP